MSKKRLGRGLGALLESNDTDITSTKPVSEERADTAGSITEVDVSSIEPNPFQPRITFDKEALMELAQSIKELGIIQPVTVRKLGKGRYQLISGERRFRASQLAGLERVPAYVRIANDQGMLEMALVENIQRQQLDAIEVAISFQRLVDECQLNLEELGERVGKNRSTVNNYLRLLRLPPAIQLGIRERKIGMGHARALLAETNEEKQLAIYDEIISNKLSVRAVEGLTRTAKNNGGNGTAVSKPASVVDEELSQELSEELGAKVLVRSSASGRGKIEIQFNNAADLQRLKTLLS